MKRRPRAVEREPWSQTGIELCCYCALATVLPEQRGYVLPNAAVKRCPCQMRLSIASNSFSVTQALLIVSVVLVLSFLLFVLWPHIRLLLRDATRLGALLSTVPPEMDVRGHVRVVLRSSLVVRGGRRQRRTSMTGAPAGAGAP